MKLKSLLIISLCCIILSCGCTADSKEQTPQPDETDTIEIYNIHPDASGNDHYNLNGEWIQLKNYGDHPVVIEGWTVKDERGHTYEFSEWIVFCGKTVTLFTGPGYDSGIENADTKAYWGSDSAIWNNDGDTIYVYNDEGVLIDSYSYRR